MEGNAQRVSARLNRLAEMEGTDMKWVWSKEKRQAINLNQADCLFIFEDSFKAYDVECEMNKGESHVHLGSFPSLQAAQEFISNLTGAVNGGQP